MKAEGFFYSFLPPAMSPDLNVRCFKIFFNEWLQKQMSKNIHCPFFSKWLFKTMKHNQVPSVHASNHVLQSAYSCEREHPQSEWSQAHRSTLPSQSRVRPAGNIRSRPLKGCDEHKIWLSEVLWKLKAPVEYYSLQSVLSLSSGASGARIFCQGRSAQWADERQVQCKHFPRTGEKDVAAALGLCAMNTFGNSVLRCRVEPRPQSPDQKSEQPSGFFGGLGRAEWWSKNSDILENRNV